MELVPNGFGCDDGEVAVGLREENSQHLSSWSYAPKELMAEVHRWDLYPHLLAQQTLKSKVNPKGPS